MSDEINQNAEAEEQQAPAPNPEELAEVVDEIREAFEDIENVEAIEDFAVEDTPMETAKTEEEHGEAEPAPEEIQERAEEPDLEEFSGVMEEEEEPAAEEAIAEAAPSPVEPQQSNGPTSLTTIDLGDYPSIAEAQELWESMKAALECDGELKIDASEVLQIDTAVLQLITSFIKTAEGQHREVVFPEPSPVFCNAAAILDLEIITARAT